MMRRRLQLSASPICSEFLFHTLDMNLQLGQFIFSKPESLLVIAWGALRMRGEFDAEYLETTLRQLPPNFELRSWLKSNT